MQHSRCVLAPWRCCPGAAAAVRTRGALALPAAAPMARPCASRRRLSRHVRAAGAAQQDAQGPLGDPNLLAGMVMAYAMQLQQQQQQQSGDADECGASLSVQDLCFHPPGSDKPLLQGVSMELPPNTLGLVVGRSGSGKTTLLQVLAGLVEETSGKVQINDPSDFRQQEQTVDYRMQKVGLVFQFPERHFLGSDLLQELTFTWPRDVAFFGERQKLAIRVQQVMSAVGLEGLPLGMPPHALSGGQQRRLALAIQLIRQPSILLLDEPLAGLDWQSRAEVVAILKELKSQCTLLVVSHDLRELVPLVDQWWVMKPGGTMELQTLDQALTTT